MNKAVFIISVFTACLIVSCQNNPYPQGEWLYSNRCSTCHMDDGSGLGQQIPSLLSSEILISDHPELVCLLYHGRKAADTRTGQLEMPANKDLTPAELANLVNYINFKWHPKVPVIQDNDIQSWLENCPP